jgi:hypothetical protein
MEKYWRLKASDGGGQTGQFLDNCEIRENADGSYDLIAVLARHVPHAAPFSFEQFAYRGFIWNLGVNTFEYGPGADEAEGNWSNNARKKPGLPGEEDGTYTGQAGSGGGVEEDCREDAASAGA